ncbi:hypothetical protein [Longibacter salinarum]|nr:hypothetical protein [Longibacter salinarum]
MRTLQTLLTADLAAGPERTRYTAAAYGLLTSLFVFVLLMMAA